MRTLQWYNNRLRRYFNEHYYAYDETAEFYPNPSDHEWLFYIPELNVKVRLICDDDGKVREFKHRRGVS